VQKHPFDGKFGVNGGALAMVMMLGMMRIMPVFHRGQPAGKR
jgi:hypothetical protein